eukprot:CAMPEP_0206483682 /NCGR_PEP_ID=MMETSP0324_2-20121206/39566_1 /ASSEMBLY_ACC=CAM_ASM_000836 /TAXON_ID=2866 /ORGANISM="Crypthecodinium cohnii, Strain Seligo" /LENGTH=271 /DNA_ID=CAMNT_0053961769 /DNA_START=167 /DNA_END=982 /DNA_ORIENTATION=-
MRCKSVFCFLFACLFGCSLALRDTNLQSEVKVEHAAAAKAEAKQAVRAKGQLKSREAAEDRRVRVEKREEERELRRKARIAARANKEKAVPNSTQLVAKREAAKAQRMAKQTVMIEAKQKARAEKAGDTSRKGDPKDKPEAGDGCVDDSDCEGGDEHLVCMPDLYDVDETFCEDYYRQEEQSCSRDDHCEKGLVCIAYDYTHPTCFAPKEEGEDCESFEECEDGSFCVRRQEDDDYDSKECSSVQLKAGELCFYGDECENGICDQWSNECK